MDGGSSSDLIASPELLAAVPDRGPHQKWRSMLDGYATHHIGLPAVIAVEPRLTGRQPDRTAVQRPAQAMKHIVLTLAFLFGALQAQAADPAPATYPAHTLPNTLLRALPKNADGRSYQLHIHLPASFANEPKRRYPVLYVTDGYWDFATIVASYNNLAYDKVVPEFITVGLGYAGDNLDYGQLRAWELSPT